MENPSFLAFDIGAASGRAILGSIIDNKLNLKEILRFPNEMIFSNGHYFWDINKLFEEIKKGIKICINTEKQIPLSIGIDTWGVDFVLLDNKNNFVELPYVYRDKLFEGKKEEFFKIMPAKELYALTGTQFLPFNSVFQLFALINEKPELINKAEKLLFMPDALNFLLCGTKKSEYTIASTSQLLNPFNKEWEKKVFIKLGISTDLMCDLIFPGQKLGFLKEKMCEELSIKPIPVVAVGSHDTASAIAAIPSSGKNNAYLSSGTWSLMGIELDESLISSDAEKFQFTNEGGVDNKIRFLKNICGLWLLQECKRSWKTVENYSYNELTELAKKGKAFSSFIDPDDACFLKPENMPEEIKKYCKKTRQTVPENHESIVRCIFESLALKYRFVLDQLKEISAFKIEALHIIGGGSQNELLNQYTANAAGLKVIAGPAEATAIGNILIQARAMGYFNTLEEIRKCVANSFDLKIYLPENIEDWNKAYHDFRFQISDIRY